MTERTKRFFVFSLFLNLMLISVGTGMIIKRAYDNPWTQAYQELLPESQNLVAREFQKARRDMSSARNEFHAARKKLTKILQQETLNEEAYETQMKKMQAAQQKMLNRKMQMMKDLMADLPPLEREKLSHRLMRPFSKHHRPRYEDAHEYPKPKGE